MSHSLPKLNNDTEWKKKFLKQLLSFVAHVACFFHLLLILKFVFFHLIFSFLYSCIDHDFLLLFSIFFSSFSSFFFLNLISSQFFCFDKQFKLILGWRFFSLFFFCTRASFFLLFKFVFFCSSLNHDELKVNFVLYNNNNQCENVRLSIYVNKIYVWLFSISYTSPVSLLCLSFLYNNERIYLLFCTFFINLLYFPCFNDVENSILLLFANPKFISRVQWKK